MSLAREKLFVQDAFRKLAQAGEFVYSKFTCENCAKMFSKLGDFSVHRKRCRNNVSGESSTLRSFKQQDFEFPLASSAFPDTKFHLPFASEPFSFDLCRPETTPKIEVKISPDSPDFARNEYSNSSNDDQGHFGGSPRSSVESPPILPLVKLEELRVIHKPAPSSPVFDLLPELPNERFTAEEKQMADEYLTDIKKQMQGADMSAVVEKLLKTRLPIRQCPFCGKIFKKKSVFAVHVEVHVTEKPYSCDICKYRTSGKAGMNQHMRATHLGPRACVRCEICGFSFPNKAALARHVKRKHLNLDFELPTERKKHQWALLYKEYKNCDSFTCHKCGRAFKSILGFCYHMGESRKCGNLKKEKKEYTCEKCGKVYKTLSVKNCSCLGQERLKKLGRPRKYPPKEKKYTKRGRPRKYPKSDDVLTLPLSLPPPSSAPCTSDQYVTVMHSIFPEGFEMNK